jgi:hypothetical protein
MEFSVVRSNAPDSRPTSAVANNTATLPTAALQSQLKTDVPVDITTRECVPVGGDPLHHTHPHTCTVRILPNDVSPRERGGLFVTHFGRPPRVITVVENWLVLMSRIGGLFALVHLTICDFR